MMVTKATTGDATADPTAEMIGIDVLGITNLLRDLRLPGIDVNAVIESQRGDLDALSRAIQQARDGYEALAKRQMEMLASGLEQLQSQVKASTSDAALRADQAKDTLGDILRNVREIAEISVRSHEQVLATIAERAHERFANLTSKR